MPEPFVLRGEFIALHRLLKAAGLCGSGGEAKSVIEQGGVRVDGHVEMRKACKIRAGQTVTYDKRELAVQPARPMAPGKRPSWPAAHSATTSLEQQ